MTYIIAYVISYRSSILTTQGILSTIPHYSNKGNEIRIVNEGLVLLDTIASLETELQFQS